MKAPERVETARLILRRPRADDAPAIFSRYANDADVTRLLGWPRHLTVDDSRGFVAFSDAAWDRWPAGPYLVESRDDGALLGSTGFGFETSTRAATGYVFAKDAWGRGYATEALAAIVDIGRQTGLVRLYALCHVDYRASASVLDKCGFTREGVLSSYADFPNLGTLGPCDVLCYARVLEQP